MQYLPKVSISKQSTKQEEEKKSIELNEDEMLVNQNPVTPRTAPPLNTPQPKDSAQVDIVQE